MKTVETTLSNRYDVDLVNHFVEQLAEFLSAPKSEVRTCLDIEMLQPGKLVASAWQDADPHTQDEVTSFYLTTDSYLYNLAADHSCFERPSVLDVVKRRIERRGSGQDVLVYGDGIGTDSIAIARGNHNVTYFDLPGKSAEFARFRFQREGLDNRISVVDRPEDIPSGKFNAVVCIEVLEHVPDPIGVMKHLHRALKNGGVALITESFESIGPEFPSHLPENFQYAGKVHRMMEGLGFVNTYCNYDPVNRPMEFMKLEMNLSGRLSQVAGRLRRAVQTRWRYLTH